MKLKRKTVLLLVVLSLLCVSYSIYQLDQKQTTPNIIQVGCFTIEFEDKYTPKSNGTRNGEWLTHPAFTFGDTELNGIWVGKFETSHEDSTYINSSTANKLGCSNENCASASGIIILPNKISIVGNNISNFFYVTRSIET